MSQQRAHKTVWRKAAETQIINHYVSLIDIVNWLSTLNKSVKYANKKILNGSHVRLFSLLLMLKI